MDALIPEKPDFFDGDVLKWTEVRGLWLGEVRYGAEFSRAVHTHERACFHFILEGGYVERYGKRYEECGALTLAFQPKGFQHSYRGVLRRSLSFSVELDDAWLAQLREHSIKLESPRKLRGGMVSWLVARLYSEFRLMETGSALVMEALAAELAVETARRTESCFVTKPPRWLKQVTDLIHDRFTESMSLGGIAKSAGVHPVHLARVFRQHHNCTVGD
jgi:AraC family transcriptional regulator